MLSRKMTTPKKLLLFLKTANHWLMIKGHTTNGYDGTGVHSKKTANSCSRFYTLIIFIINQFFNSISKKKHLELNYIIKKLRLLQTISVVPIDITCEG